jgi:hypothetical protein
MSVTLLHINANAGEEQGSSETGDTIMTALMKFMAVLGFAGALSLAATSSFAQSHSTLDCSVTNGVSYC